MYIIMYMYIIEWKHAHIYIEQSSVNIFIPVGRSSQKREAHHVSLKQMHCDVYLIRMFNYFNSQLEKTMCKF